MASITKSEGQKNLEALLPVLLEKQGFPQKARWAVRSNWASKMGHRCERNLYYMRHDWDKAEQKDWKGIGILGNLLGSWWIREMQSRGFLVIHQEVSLSDEMVKKYQIGGRIDCRVGWADIKPMLTEIKSMDDRYWQDINSYEDLVNSKAEWIRGYPAQIQLYLLSQGEEAGLFVLINKKTLEWKFIPVYLDLAYSEWLLLRADRINKANEAGVPPDRIPYGKTCMRCDFKMICLPDIKNDGLVLIDNDELNHMLDRRRELEEAHSEFETIDRESKAIAKGVGKDFIIGTDWKVEVRVSPGTRIDTKLIPIEEQSKYEVPSSRTEIEFVPLNKEKINGGK